MLAALQEPGQVAPAHESPETEFVTAARPGYVLRYRTPQDVFAERAGLRAALEHAHDAKTVEQAVIDTIQGTASQPSLAAFMHMVSLDWRDLALAIRERLVLAQGSWQEFYLGCAGEYDGLAVETQCLEDAYIRYLQPLRDYVAKMQRKETSESEQGARRRSTLAALSADLHESYKVARFAANLNFGMERNGEQTWREATFFYEDRLISLITGLPADLSDMTSQGEKWYRLDQDSKALFRSLKFCTSTNQEAESGPTPHWSSEDLLALLGLSPEPVEYAPPVGMDFVPLGLSLTLATLQSVDYLTCSILAEELDRALVPAWLIQDVFCPLVDNMFGEFKKSEFLETQRDPEGLVSLGWADATRQELLCTVSDNACGFTQAAAQSLVEGGRLSTKPGGSGTGLYVALARVSDHGGTVQIETDIDRKPAIIVRTPDGKTSIEYPPANQALEGRGRLTTIITIRLPYNTLITRP